MKTSKELLENLLNCKVYVTTRGTMGDAEGIMTVEEQEIGSFEYADVCPLAKLKEINERAYEDCVNFWTKENEFKGWSESDFFVIYEDNQYILVWEQE